MAGSACGPYGRAATMLYVHERTWKRVDGNLVADALPALILPDYGEETC